MTHIADVNEYKTKKSFKEAVLKNAKEVFIFDPSVFGNAVSGSVEHVLNKLGSFTVTNHPKRSWFASVKRNAKGDIVVS